MYKGLRKEKEFLYTTNIYSFFPLSNVASIAKALSSMPLYCKRMQGPLRVLLSFKGGPQFAHI